MAGSAESAPSAAIRAQLGGRHPERLSNPSRYRIPWSPIVWTKKTTLAPTVIFMQSEKRVYWIAADVIVRWAQAAAPALAVKSNANG